MRSKRFFLGGLLASLVLATPLHAQQPFDRPMARPEQALRAQGPDYERLGPDSRRQAPRMSLSDAVAAAERRTGGRALSAEPYHDNGRPGYRVKVLTPNGRVQILYFSAH